MNIEKFEDLEQYLENWNNFHNDGSGPYDFVGAMSLLSALLRNMQKNTLETDFDDLKDYFDEKELHTLRLMFEKLSIQ
jgi:hypothetical protein